MDGRVSSGLQRSIHPRSVVRDRTRVDLGFAAHAATIVRDQPPEDEIRHPTGKLRLQQVREEVQEQTGSSNGAHGTHTEIFRAMNSMSYL